MDHPRPLEPHRPHRASRRGFAHDRALALALVALVALVALFAPRRAYATGSLRDAAAPAAGGTAVSRAAARVGREYTLGDAYLLAGYNQLQGALLLGLRHRWDAPRSASPVLDGRRFEVGLEVNANPAFTAVGMYAEWTPLAILQLRGQLDGYGYYGLFGALLPFDDARAPFGDAVRSQRAHEARPGGVFRALARATLQGQLGPVALRSVTEVAAYALAGDADYFIDLERDMLFARSELFVQHEAQLLVEPYRSGSRGLYVGLFHQVAAATRAGYRRQRVGLLAEWVFHERLGFLARPRFAAVVGYHLEDRNRAGTPFFLAGFGGELDL